MPLTRRVFLEQIATATGAVVLAPYAVGCSSEPAPTTASPEPSSGGDEVAAVDPLRVPVERPDDWDAIAFNRERGNAGAIPDSYLPDINGPEGDMSHLGKHLPFVPALSPASVPAGMLAIMWGDPSKGHTPHPNAPPSEDNPEGHWYDWIRIRKATADEAAEVESKFSGWPDAEATDNGAYAAFEGEDPTENSGKNTVYLVELPPDVNAGDLVRVHAHCLTHGEYVDFLTLPT